MGMSKEFRDLGMDRPIARRDFLNGVAISVAGGLAALENFAAAAPQDAPSKEGYPPVNTGLRGNYPSAVDIFDPIRQGRYTQFPVPDGEIREEYDLVIVGAGMSGLSAAHFWRTALGTNQRILILDNHDDFGGHAKRNEFHYNGRTFVGVGGTLGIATPYPYSYASKALIKELGVEVDRGPEFTNRDLEAKFNLGTGTFFCKEIFRQDCLLAGGLRSPGFIAKMPISEEARKDLIRLQGKNPDYLAGMRPEEKKAKLARMSYQDFLLNYAKANREVLHFVGGGGRNSKKVDSTPALEAAQRGSMGTNGLGLTFEEGFNEGSYRLHFPDGNASIGRLLVSRLIPAAVGGKKLDMNTIVQAPFDYSKLDEPSSKMRIRLGSPVVRVINEGPPENAHSVKIAYMNGGRLQAVRGRNCILACYNQLIPALIPEIPQHQKDALAYPAKVPLNYTNVLIKKWTAFQKLGVSRISFPGMWYTNANLDAGSTFGGYRGVTTPDEPMIVHMTCTPAKPGLPRKEQNRAGAQEMLSMTFQDFELKIRDQLARALGPAGFGSQGRYRCD